MTTKIIVSTRNPADILTNVVSVSTGDREGTSRIVIQVTKTVQRALQVNDDAILRHVSTGDNKGSVLLRDFATSVEFKAATVQHVDNGFIVHADDDKSVFFNSAFSSYVAEGKPSVSEDDEEEKPAAKTTKAKTTAKTPAKTAAKTATKKKVDVEDEGDVEEDVEAEEEKPAKTTKAKTTAKTAAKTAAKTTAAKTTAAKKKADSLIDDEDGEDDVEVEEKPAKTAKAKTTAKTAAKTTAAKAKTTKAKPEIADDADDWGDDE